MCGRFILSANQEELEKALKVKLTGQYRPSYNVAPTQSVWTISNEANRSVTPMKWGMVPSWWKFKNRQLINVRSESFKDKPFFRSLLNDARCVVLADGFYEWDKSVKPSQPYLFRLKSGGLIAFPAVWEREGDGLACALITVPSNELIGRIHERMPAIIEPTMIHKWIQKDMDPQAALNLVEPYPAEKMVMLKIGAIG